MKRKNGWPDISQRKILSVQVGAGHFLLIGWEGGTESEIDLTPWLRGNALLSPLLDRELFARAEMGEFGGTVAWEGERFEIDALHLGYLELEQEGVPVTPEAFRRWRERGGLTLDGAAEALGVSRRMVAYYEAGTHFVPRHIGLACKGFDSLAIHRRAA